jgi:nucleotide-binding universal stress UspA family protein
MAKTKTPEQRIVVTIDITAQAAPAIALAAALARARKRALHGLFIEDTDLLNVARLPFTLEFSRFGGPPRDLSDTELERSMARLAARYRKDLEQQALALALPWSYASVRSSKRLVIGHEEASAELLVIGQPARAAAVRTPRVLLLDGNRPGVLQALAAVLDAPGYESAELMVHGEFDSQMLNTLLASHPQVTRRLMGAPSLDELLTSPRYQPSLVLLAQDADEIDPCLQLADCPVIVAG